MIFTVNFRVFLFTLAPVYIVTKIAIIWYSTQIYSSAGLFCEDYTVTIVFFVMQNLVIVIGVGFMFMPQIVNSMQKEESNLQQWQLKQIFKKQQDGVVIIHAPKDKQEEVKQQESEASEDRTVSREQPASREQAGVGAEENKITVLFQNNAFRKMFNFHLEETEINKKIIKDSD